MIWTSLPLALEFSGAEKLPIVGVVIGDMRDVDMITRDACVGKEYFALNGMVSETSE